MNDTHPEWLSSVDWVACNAVNWSARTSSVTCWSAECCTWTGFAINPTKFTVTSRVVHTNLLPETTSLERALILISDHFEHQIANKERPLFKSNSNDSAGRYNSCNKETYHIYFVILHNTGIATWTCIAYTWILGCNGFAASITQAIKGLTISISQFCIIQE